MFFIYTILIIKIVIITYNNVLLSNKKTCLLIFKISF